MVWKTTFTTLGDLPLNVTIFIMHARNCVMEATLRGFLSEDLGSIGSNFISVNESL